MAGAKRPVLLVLVLALLLSVTGCGRVLERSHGKVEPYEDRYWEKGPNSTMRAESYQDLVNSLLLLVEQKAAGGLIRYYVEEAPYASAQRAAREVIGKTMSGAYLLEDISVDMREETACRVLTYTMTYRSGTVDLEDIIHISNNQSLADLLRLGVREKHRVVTARLGYELTREEILQTVESVWGEEALRLSEGLGILPEQYLDEDRFGPVPPRPQSCPWTVHFYPDWDGPAIVEIRLK